MAGPDRCLWGILPPELVARIVHFLSPNEVACTCRLINKTIAKQFNGCISVRLSQPVPCHAFACHWGDERGVHGLTLERRQQLLCLTACSGVIANLEVVVAAVGCGLTNRIMNTVAEGGPVAVCVWLLDRGCPCDVREVIRRAVRAGHMEVVRWALAQSPGEAENALIEAAGAGQRALCEEILPLVLAAGQASAISKAACRAAEGGHVELTEWLLEQLAEQSEDSAEGELLRCAARGFELPALQRFYHSRLGSYAFALVEFIETHNEAALHGLATAAFASRTPDWRAKLEWLEAAGCGVGQIQSWDAITNCGDVVERLTLLRECDLLDADGCLESAVSTNNLTVVRYLWSEGLLTDAQKDRTMEWAMGDGDLAVVTELLGAGGTIGLDGVHRAARHGHLHVLRWLEGPEAGPAAAAVYQEALQEGGKLAEYGARSGSLELMEWLWERGCPSNERVFTAAAGAGNVTLLDRLVARACPMSCDAYLPAGYNGDLATLRYLRRLDCPWGPGCTSFIRAVYDGVWEFEDDYGGCSLTVLRWMVAEGCPVDWQSASDFVTDSVVVAGDVLDWIESHI